MKKKRHARAFSVFQLSLTEMRRRPAAFLPFFLLCVSGLFILYSLLFFQYGCWLSELRISQSRYHVLLPQLTDRQAEEIGALPYVQSAVPFRYGDSVTAYIKLRDNDPEKLRAYCVRIIRDVGLDQTPAYRDNVIFQTSGPMDNWINREYCELAATPFFMRSLSLTALCMASVVGYMLCAMAGKVRADGREYGTLRALGFRRIDICRCLAGQYLSLYALGSFAAIPLSLGVYRLLSVLLKQLFTDNYLQLDFAFPAKEVLFWLPIGALLLLLGTAVVTRLVKREPKDGIAGSAEASLSFVKVSDRRFVRRPSAAHCNLLRAWRCRTSTLWRIVKKAFLLLLPAFFLILAIMLYGMREMSEYDRDFGLFSLAPNYITEEIAQAAAALDGVERTEKRVDYGEGNYGQLLIYAEEGRQAEIERAVEALANAHYLQFYNDYRNKIMNVEQSDIFTVYYLAQAAVLLLASVVTMRAEEAYHLRRRRPEMAVMKSMGLCNSCRELFSAEILTLLLSALLSGIAAAAAHAALPGASWLRPGFLIAAALVFLALFLLPHAALYRKTRRSLARANLIEWMEGDGI